MNDRRTMRWTHFTVPILTFMAYGLAQTETPNRSAQETAVFRGEAREVLIDAVVRDRSGRLIRGLAAADFEITENGVRQQVLSVRETAPRGGPEVSTGSVPAARNTAQINSPGQLHLVSLVFERLGPDGRRLSRQAALELVKARSSVNTYYAVFVIQNRLGLLQSFTSDAAAVRTAIGRATGGTNIDFQNDLEGIRSAAGATRGSEGAAESAAANGRSGGIDGGGLANEQMQRMTSDILQFAENASREQQGRSSLYSLLAIANEQRRVPGRKTVLYFSEGLQLPNSVWHVLQSLVSAANRANVSIYSIDSRGLSANRDSALAEQMLAQSGNANRRGLYNSSQQGAAVTRAEVMAADTGMDAIRANPQNAMREIADSTGGFLVANTNDFRAPIRRISEEMESYYELSYRPSDDRYDGQFRSVQVHVKRSGASVKARSGYFAFPPGADALFPYEAPLLKAIEERPLPRGVNYSAAALRFRPGANSVQVALIVDAALGGITFRKIEDLYRAHLSAMALLKDDRGQVAARVTRDVPMTIPANGFDRFLKSGFVLTQYVEAPAGRYTLESALADREGGRLGARRTAVAIPSPPGGVRLSSLVFVRRVETSSTTDLRDPFQVTGGRVVPYLTDTLPRTPGQPMVVYFTVYPMDPDSARPKLTIEILSDQTVLARVRPDLPEPLSDGSIRYVASAPADSLEPGLYEIRVTAEQAGTSARESLFFTLE